MVILIILTFLLSFQNISLKKKYSHGNKYERIISALAFEHRLKRFFLFKFFPIEIKLDNFHFHNEIKKNNINGYLIMIFDLKVCGKCLYDALEVLKYFKERAQEKKILYLALIGLNNKDRESEIISLYRCGNLFFPFKISKVGSIYEIFKLNSNNYLDTPFFFYLDYNYKVLDIFKPVYLETEEIYNWMEIVTN